MKTLNVLLAIVVAFTFAFITGCGCDHNNVTNVTNVAPTSDVPSSIQTLVDEENDYRLSLGQTMLSPGLSCSVQQVSSGQWLSSSSPGYQSAQGVVVLTGTSYSFLDSTGFNQPSVSGDQPFNVLPVSIQPNFENLNFKLNCSGFVVAETDGYTDFEMSSDDGAILTVDGTQLINNDGNHGITTKTGSKSMRRGVKTFSLLFAQTGSGSFGLVLNKDGALAPSNVFYH